MNVVFMVNRHFSLDQTTPANSEFSESDNIFFVSGEETLVVNHDACIQSGSIGARICDKVISNSRLNVLALLRIYVVLVINI